MWWPIEPIITAY